MSAFEICSGLFNNPQLKWLLSVDQAFCESYACFDVHSGVIEILSFSCIALFSVTVAAAILECQIAKKSKQLHTGNILAQSYA